MRPRILLHPWSVHFDTHRWHHWWHLPPGSVLRTGECHRRWLPLGNFQQPHWFNKLNPVLEVHTRPLLWADGPYGRLGNMLGWWVGNLGIQGHRSVSTQFGHALFTLLSMQYNYIIAETHLILGYNVLYTRFLGSYVAH